MIVLVVKIKVQEGKKEEFIKIAKLMIEGSQKEAGNIEYNLYDELNEANTVAFIEKWKDQEALDIHEKTPHFTDNIQKIVDLCAQPPVFNKFKVVE